MSARKKKGRRIFVIFSSQGPSEFLVSQQSAMGRVPKDAGDSRTKSQEKRAQEVDWWSSS